MNRLRQILKDRRGVAFPLIIAIALVVFIIGGLIFLKVRSRKQ